MFQAKYNNKTIIPSEYLPSIHNKKICCPYCDNNMIFIDWKKNVKHFRHFNSKTHCILYDKVNKNNFLRDIKEHSKIQNEIFNYFKKFLSETDKVCKEYTIWWYENYRRADIYIEFLYNNKIYKTIIEVQLSYNNFEEINARTSFYKKHWIDNIIWISTNEKSWLTLNFNEVQNYIIYYIKEWILWYAYYKKEINKTISNIRSRYKDFSFYHKKIINEKQLINKNDTFIENIKIDSLWYDFLISWKSNSIEKEMNNYNKQEDLKVIEHKIKINEDEKKLHERIKADKKFHRNSGTLNTKNNFTYTPKYTNTPNSGKTYTPYKEELSINFKLKLEKNDIINKEISVWDYVIVSNNIKTLRKWVFFKKFNARQSFYRIKEISNWICNWNSDINDKEEYWYCRNWFKKEQLIVVSKECYLDNF